MRSSIIVVAVMVATAFALPAAAVAQAPTTTLDQLSFIIHNGDRVTVQDHTGQTVQGAITEVTAKELAINADGVVRRWATSEVREVRQRARDGIWNGALIGAAISGGLAALNYLDNECIGDPACARMVLFSATVGAGIGAAIDAMIRANRLVYRSPSSGVSWSLGPVVSSTKRQAGFRILLSN
jgi:hypothetical protein